MVPAFQYHILFDIVLLSVLRKFPCPLEEAGPVVLHIGGTPLAKACASLRDAAPRGAIP